MLRQGTEFLASLALGKVTTVCTCTSAACEAEPLELGGLLVRALHMHRPQATASHTNNIHLILGTLGTASQPSHLPKASVPNPHSIGNQGSNCWGPQHPKTQMPLVWGVLPGPWDV